jgi:hypothetical protein
LVGCQGDLFPLTPALSPKGARGKGSRLVCFSKPEFGSIFQVGATLVNTSVSPLSLKFAKRKGADLCAVQNLSSARYLKSMYL